MKLKSLKITATEDVPDHIVQEIIATATKMGMPVFEIANSQEPNIALAALSWVHASLIHHLISEEEGELERAAKCYAMQLMHDIELIKKSTK